MSVVLEPLGADAVYVARLEPRRAPAWRRVVRAGLDLWCATSGGLLELSTAGDVVVRRRVDGVAELRVFAGPPASAAPLLARLADDLATLDADEFRAAWGID